MGVGPERHERMLPRNAMGRRGTPRKVAIAVIFLDGTPASSIGGALTARVQR